MSYHGNLPDNFSQAAFDAYWGKPTSGAVEDALAAELEIQDMREQLVTKIKARKSGLGLDINEDMLGALEDGARSSKWLQEHLIEQEAEAAEDAKADAQAARYDARRDEEVFGRAW